MEDRVALREPARRAAVQLAAPALRAACRRPRRGSARGRTESAVALRPHQQVRHEARRGRSRVAPSRWRSTSRVEALPEHGGGLQRRLVGRFEPVEAGLHQALDRARDAGLRALLGVAQQLLEEERVAGGALDAALGQLRRWRRGTARPARAPPPAERAEVDRRGAGCPRPRRARPGRAGRPRSGRSSPGRRGTRPPWRRAGPDAPASAGPPSARPRRPGAAAAPGSPARPAAPRSRACPGCALALSMAS